MKSTVKSSALPSALQCAVDAAQAAGHVLRQNHRARKKIGAATQHDIKLELDVRCQKLIERILLRHFPSVPILGEEGSTGNPDATSRWVVDPIDGTVNFAYGIPHCCTSIALQTKIQPRHSNRLKPAAAGSAPAADGFETVLGVVYDPFCNELWTALRDKPARLNGQIIRASSRARLSECLISVGFSKQAATMRRMLPVWLDLVHRVRKLRNMGSAALGLAYLAAGRLDAYLEYGLRIWDIAAGALLVESAGGRFWQRPLDQPYWFHIIASNQPLHRQLARYR